MKARTVASAARAVIVMMLGVSALMAVPRAAAAVDEEVPQRAMLDLVVNEVPKGQVVVAMRGSDVLAAVADLERAGLRVRGGRRETVDEQEFVSLQSLAPGIRFVLDQRGLAVRITSTPDLLTNVTVLDFQRAHRPAYEQSHATSAFVNYGLNWRQASGYDATGEAGASWAGALATTTFSWSSARALVRGMTSVTFDRSEHLRRVVIGDSHVGSHLLGASLSLAGVRVASEYSIDPYFLRYPTLGLSGAATTPSTVEVYVDNRLVRQQRVEPGQFQISNLQVPVGSGQTRLVIRDAFGREQQVQTPYYLATTVLARGLHEYEYALGYPRQDVAASSWSYGGLSAFGHHRYGFTRHVTAGLRAEASAGLLNGGPTVNARLPVGEIEIAVAGSRIGGRTGGAASAGYSFISRKFSAGMTGRTWSDAYRTVGNAAALDAPRHEVDAYTAVQVGPRLGLTLQQASTQTRSGIRQARSSVLGTTRISRHAHAFFVLARSVSRGRSGIEASLGLTYSLASRTSATIAATHGEQGSGLSAEVQRSLPFGTGFGYRVQAGEGTSAQAGGRLEYQNAFGRYSVESAGGNGTTSPSLSVAGGLVGIGGKVFAARPVDQGFALVRVPGVAGVRGYLSNQEIGRTNRRGDLLVPNLLPYYANRLSIADEDVPLDRSISTTERSVAPPYRGGALVVFGATVVRAVTGRVVLDLGGLPVIPEFGDLSVESGGQRLESPIGRAGEYYLEGLQPGTFHAQVRFQGAACSFDLRVPASDQAVVDVGTSRCTVGVAR